MTPVATQVVRSAKVVAGGASGGGGKGKGACLAFVRRICGEFQVGSGHDSVVLPQLRVESARPGQITASMVISRTNLNRLGSLHGGCIASLTDTIGSLAIASKGFYSTGVSTDINTTYVKSGGTEGDTVLLQGDLISIGKTLAFTRIQLLHPVSNAVLAYGSHTKFIGKCHGHPENVTFDPTGDVIVQGKQPHEWENVD
ncbi:hypothetical protein BCV70DRAFT_221081 [Testicularia cyperi]|uniref:Thioesterase domain-containing protein n=1 Tax=Testicularia cyperi TaxID=1882483 RepID=A0A317XJJ3_9BASI|nr:hypothetical protein BCV70DRAFT_221081 [Testicularia cyperi]